MDELRGEVGANESFKKKLVRSRLKWAGHVERMGDENLRKRADAYRERMKTGAWRPRMRWTDCDVEQQQRI